MVCYSSHVMEMVESLVTEWHLVTELFTMVQMVHTIQLATI